MSDATPPPPGPELEELFALFTDRTPPAFAEVAATDVPPPYHGLLVHSEHMTVTVEAFHGDRVDVQVLASRHDGDSYARKILLTRQRDDAVVQFGIVRIRLDLCSPPVRAAILRQDTPLGRILIDHDVLRRIEPTAFFRVEPGPVPAHWFGEAGATRPTYGRLGFIYCDGQPAVELLEIVTPVG
jgi:chorismate-pyruvate lyase